MSDFLSRLRCEPSGLFANASGVAMVEFAYALPILVVLGLGGTELANYAATKMQVSQLALHVSDHSSRVGENGVLQDIRIFEDDINDVFAGANLQAGRLDLQDNGRVVLSSLRQNAEGGQWLQWQRCYGALAYESRYGEEGDGETGNDFPGMGPEGNEVTAAPGTAVMFVEVTYRYQPLFANASILPIQQEFTEIAAFNVRDDRDLSQVYPRDGVTAADCD